MNILFDVDGTLVQSYALDSDCFMQAVYDVLGDVFIAQDWAHYTHVTDAGILAQICADNGIASDKAREVRDSFAARVQAQFRADPLACTEVPGAAAMLAVLTGKARLGLATGGWAVTATAKLRQAGIRFDPETLFSSDISAERIAIMRACLGAVGDPAAPIVYVGDGEWDMQATETLGWHFIGIGPRLHGRVARWIPDFQDEAFATHLADLSGGRLRL